MPICRICRGHAGRECFCSGCNSYVCEDHPFAPAGKHRVEQHEDQGDEEKEEEE